MKKKLTDGHKHAENPYHVNEFAEHRRRFRIPVIVHLGRRRKIHPSVACTYAVGDARARSRRRIIIVSITISSYQKYNMATYYNDDVIIYCLTTFRQRYNDCGSTLDEGHNDIIMCRKKNNEK